MRINLDDLRRHYASLSDEALREVDRDSLVDIARQCFDLELARRDLPKRAKAEPAIRAESPDRSHFGSTGAPEWLAEAACACAYPAYPGRDASDAKKAHDVLENAGIPSYLELRKVEPDAYPLPDSEYRLMVPAEFNLQAASVLNKEIFNEQIVEGWRTHLGALSDDELLASRKEELFEGLLDRVDRMSRAYDEEIARRRLRTRS